MFNYSENKITYNLKNLKTVKNRGGGSKYFIISTYKVYNICYTYYIYIYS